MSKPAAAFGIAIATVIASWAVPPAPAIAEPPPALSAAAPVQYRAPASEPVVDPFRPPTTRYGPGNRGLEYATQPGEPVRAAADGLVLFAGGVGGTLDVAILHADGIRTSYSRLSTIVVHRGQHVAAGAVIATAAQQFHFGARAGSAYVDPAVLLATPSSPTRAYLVPDEGPSP